MITRSFCLTLLLFFLSNVHANASCHPFTHGKDLIRQSAVIFTGKVIETVRTSNKSPSQKNDSFPYNYYSSFKVDKIYKGTENSLIKIYYRDNDTTETVHPLTVGSSLLVFALDDDNKNYYFTTCRQNYFLRDQKSFSLSSLETYEALMDEFPSFKDPEIERRIREKNERMPLIEKIIRFFK